MYGVKRRTKEGKLFQIVDNKKQPINVTIYAVFLEIQQHIYYIYGVSKSLLFETPLVYMRVTEKPGE